jgi:hypothetical protein
MGVTCGMHGKDEKVSSILLFVVWMEETRSVDGRIVLKVTNQDIKA